ncbi:MAG: metal ABC transporter ATP-binding protein, partial [Myxococcota bacterium]|nr:metal ABC transporter ATP-binding protein [Myxococcota bacterium]
IFGREPTASRVDVGYVPQYPEFDPAFPISVWDVVLMGRRARRGIAPGWRPEDRSAAERALEQVGMADLRGERIGDLSGGQRQRIYIARALVANARILLLDEPTASVDSRFQESIYGLLSELNHDVAIVLVTHDVGVMSSHVKQIACLNHRLFTHGDQMLTAEMLEQAYGCPVDLIAHGVPHRVLAHHEGDSCGIDCQGEHAGNDGEEQGQGQGEGG